MRIYVPAGHLSRRIIAVKQRNPDGSRSPRDLTEFVDGGGLFFPVKETFDDPESEDLFTYTLSAGLSCDDPPSGLVTVTFEPENVPAPARQVCHLDGLVAVGGPESDRETLITARLIVQGP